MIKNAKNIDSVILEDLKIKVFEKILDVHCKLESLLKIKIPTIPIHFTLRGKTAGLFTIRVVGGVPIEQNINFNLMFLYNEGQHFIDNVVPHEYCHYVVALVMGGDHKTKKYKPHGKEWSSLMKSLGVEDRIYHQYKCLPKKAFKYNCNCENKIIVSTLRHNKIKKYNGKIPKITKRDGKKVRVLMSYSCLKCGVTLNNNIESHEIYN